MTSDESREDYGPNDATDRAGGKIAILLDARGDPAVHAAADVERLLENAPALRRIVDLAREHAAPEDTRASERPGAAEAGRGRAQAERPGRCYQ